MVSPFNWTLPSFFSDNLWSFVSANVRSPSLRLAISASPPTDLLMTALPALASVIF
ncbi:hypothetical protein PFI31113_04977 [Pandoraea fibrosis]|uniref:Uncharacterized protein n=1 Tax=Pandoraea fibrosis TaxID=1891094 RepID=A0A5E4Z418_9BURK|nr:hypothetical protein PFI31113_04977 [Pandoraea fibrosis]